MKLFMDFSNILETSGDARAPRARFSGCVLDNRGGRIRPESTWDGFRVKGPYSYWVFPGFDGFLYGFYSDSS